MSLADKVFDRYKLAKPYILWFGIPFTIVFGMDYLKAIASVIQFFAGTTLVMFVASFIVGFAVELFDLAKGKKYEESMNARLFKFVPMLVWGRKSVRWLLEDETKKSRGEQGET